MGLDMYLTREVYIGADWEHNGITGKVTLKRGGVPITVNSGKISEITEGFAYWRKANAIHRWFVDNVQDGEDECGTHYVYREHFESLLKDVNEVLADHSKANAILPSQSGFFFGGIEYDEWYFKDLEYTKKVVLEALKDLDKKEAYVTYKYHSSW